MSERNPNAEVVKIAMFIAKSQLMITKRMIRKAKRNNKRFVKLLDKLS